MKKVREYIYLFALEVALVATGSIVSILILYLGASIWMWLVVLVLALLVIWLPRLKSIKTRNNKTIPSNETLHHIDWAIEEKNAQHFEQEIRNLYPQLIKCKLKVPLIDPVRIGLPVYDNTWYEFHLTFLKALRRQIRNSQFNSDQWNADINRENAKRKNVAEQYTRRNTKSKM